MSNMNAGWRETEAQFTKKVIEYLKLKGWMVTHFRPAQARSGRWMTALQGDPGFVDIVAARAGDVWFLELKSAGGRLQAQQRVWAKHLPAGRYLVVYPKDFDRLMEALG